MKYLIYLAILLLIILGSFWSGYEYHDSELKRFSDTLIVRDTNTYTIYDHTPWYHIVLDTVEYQDTIPFTIDTAQVIKDYYAKYTYTRDWKDSLINVKLTSELSQNKFIKETLKYKILRPQTIINNTVITKSLPKYYGEIQLSNVKMLNSVSLNYVRDGYSIGVGYSPYSNGVIIKGGFPLGKLFRK